jgi:aldose 1-epimerase
MDQRIELRAGPMRAVLFPAAGGRVGQLHHALAGDVLVPLADARFNPMQWPRAGAYPLVPYHNRIAGARLVNNGETIQLVPHPAAAPHSLHGPAHRRPWRVVDAAGVAARLALEYAEDEDWPWPFLAEQHFELSPLGMTVTLSVTNRGQTSMPAGLGWHPYFNSAGPASANAEFCWRHADDYLPDGLRAPATQAAIGAPTAYLQEWSGAAAVLLSGARLTIGADPLFAHLVLHRSDGITCIEPVSHVANGFNLAAQGVADTGTVWLDPGATLAGKIWLCLQLTSSHDENRRRDSH